MNALLSEEQLLDITGYERSGDLERALRDQGVHVFKGKGGKLWTTLDLINKAGGLLPSSPAANVPHYDPEGFR